MTARIADDNWDDLGGPLPTRHPALPWRAYSAHGSQQSELIDDRPKSRRPREDSGSDDDDDADRNERRASSGASAGCTAEENGGVADPSEYHRPSLWTRLRLVWAILTGRDPAEGQNAELVPAADAEDGSAKGSLATLPRQVGFILVGVCALLPLVLLLLSMGGAAGPQPTPTLPKRSKPGLQTAIGKPPPPRPPPPPPPPPPARGAQKGARRPWCRSRAATTRGSRRA